MSSFTKISSDNTNAPDAYFVRVDLGKDEEKKTGNRFDYHQSLSKLAKTLGCSRNQVKDLVQERRTISFEEFIKFNSK